MDTATVNNVQLNDDPFDAADSAVYVPRKKTYFGTINARLYFCVFQKGAPGGKAPFNPNVHKPEQRRVAIILEFNPLSNAPNQYTIKREVVDTSDEWTKITKPSLEKLQVSSRTLSGRYVRITLANTGRTWDREVTDEYGQTKKVTIEGTAFVFDAVYATEDECSDAANDYFSGRETAEAAPHQQVTNGASSAASGRDVALKFLTPLWGMAQGDKERFYKLIKESTVVAPHFDENSPEVMALVNG